ncbi:MAG TPA: hypothetical protein VJ733_04815, partial [Candidatus Binatia bacterium]|nr:hypothetical protein [Candidatus Binatia bacterium]
MNTTVKLTRIRRNSLFFERLSSSPLTGEERGEGEQGFHRPLTLALSREGRGDSDSEARNLTGDERPTKSLLLFPALIMLTLLSMGVGGFVQTGS